MIAIPAIDLLENQVVRLFQGDYRQETCYPVAPIEYAQHIVNAGLTHLHLVDLSGAKEGKLVHTSILKEITSITSLTVDFGGGVQHEEDIETILNAGASQVVIGSLCVKNTNLVRSWIEYYGPERFVLALDTFNGQLKINGWQESTGFSIEKLMTSFSEYAGLTILTTDIQKDGTGMGPNTTLYEKLISAFPKQRWIASGGVERLTDLQKLREVGCYACVVGKALLDGKISLNKLKQFNDGSL